MKINEINHADLAQLSRQYRREQLVLLKALEIPSALHPSRSDVVLLDQDGMCEIYIGAEHTYVGDHPVWAAAMRQPESPGRTRLIDRVAGGLEQGIERLQMLLSEIEPQRVSHPLPEQPLLVPSPDDLPVRDHAQQVSAPRQVNAAFQLRDLVEESRRKRQHLVGRQELLNSLKTLLLRHNKPNVILTGKPGVGKTSVVSMLAQEIADGNVPDDLKSIALYDLPIGPLLEHARFVGDVERNLRGAVEQSGKPVFFVDEFHQLGRSELSSIRDILKPALAEGKIRVIGATTDKEWRLVEDAAFRRRFTELNVDEPSPRETYDMMLCRASAIEAHHKLSLPDKVLREAIMLAHRHLPNKVFPDKAIDVLDHAGAICKAQAGTSHDDQRMLAPCFLHDAVLAQAGSDRWVLSFDDAKETLRQLEVSIRGHLYGQDKAIGEVLSILDNRLSSRFIGWERSIETLIPYWDQRPLACLLLIGGTGTGKSETGKLIAQEFFDGRITILNGNDVGSEGPHGVAMWVGSPPGYVGSSQGGSLTNDLRANSKRLIQIEEIEKANLPAVQNILLSLLGEGTVTDHNTGETLSAADCIIMCTSNITVSGQEMRHVGFAAESDDPGTSLANVRGAVAAYLLPEVIGRFHGIVQYADLTLEALWKIWSVQRQQLEQRIGDNVHIELDHEARKCIQARFQTKGTGARGVQDLFRATVVPVASRLRSGSTLHLTSDGETLLTSDSVDEKPVAE